jgi:hypothetical protein
MYTWTYATARAEARTAYGSYGGGTGAESTCASGQDRNRASSSPPGHNDFGPAGDRQAEIRRRCGWRACLEPVLPGVRPPALVEVEGPLIARLVGGDDLADEDRVVAELKSPEGSAAEIRDRRDAPRCLQDARLAPARGVRPPPVRRSGWRLFAHHDPEKHLLEHFVVRLLRVWIGPGVDLLKCDDRTEALGL